MTAETRRFLRGNGLQASVYTPLHLDLHEVTGKGALTGEVLMVAGEDNIGVENTRMKVEVLRGLLPKLHRTT
jgi:hypothetical protein